jgi:hypothetical protein
MQQHIAQIAMVEDASQPPAAAAAAIVAAKTLAAKAEIASRLPPLAGNSSMSEHDDSLSHSFDISKIRYIEIVSFSSSVERRR